MNQARRGFLGLLAAVCVAPLGLLKTRRQFIVPTAPMKPTGWGLASDLPVMLPGKRLTYHPLFDLGFTEWTVSANCVLNTQGATLIQMRFSGFTTHKLVSERSDVMAVAEKIRVGVGWSPESRIDCVAAESIVGKYKARFDLTGTLVVG
jgi:hypothetical protein